MIEAFRNLVQASSMLVTCVIVSVFIPPEMILPTNQTHFKVPPQYNQDRFPSAVAPYFRDSDGGPVVDPITGSVGDTQSSWWPFPSGQDTNEPEKLPANENQGWFSGWGHSESESESEQPKEPETVPEPEPSSWWNANKEPEPEPEQPSSPSWWDTQPTQDDDILPSEPVVVTPPTPYYEPPKPAIDDSYPPDDFIARTIWTANMIYSKPELAWFRMTIDIVSLLVCIIVWWMCRSPKPEVNQDLIEENEKLKQEMLSRDDKNLQDVEKLTSQVGSRLKEYHTIITELQQNEEVGPGAPDAQRIGHRSDMNDSTLNLASINKVVAQPEVTKSVQAIQPDSAPSVSKKSDEELQREMEAKLKAEEDEQLRTVAEAKKRIQEEKRAQEEAKRAEEEKRQAAADAARRRQEAEQTEKQRLAEQEASRKAEEEEASRKAEERLRALGEAKKKIEEDARRAQEEAAERQRIADEAKRAQEEEARRRAEEEEERQRFEQEEARRAEEEAEQERQRLAAEQEAEQERQRLAAEQEKQRLAAAQKAKEEEAKKATEEAKPKVVAVGMKAKVRDQVGIIRFVGPTQFAAGEWAGVEFDVPIGKNDGTMQGVNYFGPIKPQHGLFIRKEVVQLVD